MDSGGPQPVLARNGSRCMRFLQVADLSASIQYSARIEFINSIASIQHSARDNVRQVACVHVVPLILK